jgi:hypothetical protein
MNLSLVEFQSGLAGNPSSSRHIRRLPHNVTIVSEIKRFLPPTSLIATSGIELTNGTVSLPVRSTLY